VGEGPDRQNTYRIAGISTNVHPSLSGRIVAALGALATLGGPAPSAPDGLAPLLLSSPEAVLPLGEIADGGPTLLTELRARDTHYGILLMIRDKGQPAYRPIETQMAAVFSSSTAQGIGLAQMHRLHEDLRLYLERERIARDLHDVVIQRIFAAGLSISALAKHLPTPATRERAAGITRELDTTIAELRATIHSLRTGVGEQETPSSRILRAIRLGCEPLDFTPRVHLGDGLDTLDDETLLTHLLAVITESLSNVVRHAHARSVGVDVGLENQTLIVRVSDDGRGFERSQVESGLANMAQRAAELGGTLRVESTPDDGTALSWAVPVP
jgi:signal transduction histidine kinase